MSKFKKMEISTNLVYLDSKGNRWKVFSKTAFGRALMVREDKPTTSVELPYRDIRASMTIAD